MKVEFKAAEQTQIFTPYTLTIEVENQEESQALRAIGGLDSSIPRVVHDNGGSDAHANIAKDLCRNFNTVHRDLDRELSARTASTGMVIAKRRRA
jgi:hypothetical protein